MDRSREPASFQASQLGKLTKPSPTNVLFHGTRGDLASPQHLDATTSWELDTNPLTRVQL